MEEATFDLIPPGILLPTFRTRRPPSGLFRFEKRLRTHTVHISSTSVKRNNINFSFLLLK